MQALSGNLTGLQELYYKSKAFNATDEIINAQDGTGQSALLLASHNGNMDSVEFILKHGADVYLSSRDGNTPLIQASADGHISVVKKLIERGARLDASQKDGTNAAYRAAQNGHLDVLKLLIQIHPNFIDIKGHKGQTPFIAAAKNGHPDVAEYLLSVQWNITFPKGKFVRITLMAIFHGFS